MKPNPYLENRNKNDARANLPNRLKILLGVVLALMALLVVQLAFLTIKQGPDFQAEVKRSDETVEKGNSPRGLIYDTTGRVITGNKPQTAVTYTRGKATTSTQIAKIAAGLSKYLTIDTKRLSDRSKADYYLTIHPKQATKIQAIIEKEYPKASKSWTTTQLNTAMSKYVQQQGLDKEVDANQAMIFQRMSGAYALSTTFIQESGVSDQSQAEIGEHLGDFPGVKIGSSWTRDYPQGDDFQPLVGTVTDEATGLPADRLHTLLAQGYSQNEPVGSNALEKQYESILKGSPSQTLITSNANGLKTSKVKYEGQAGDSLKLTINSEFQKKVQQILDSNIPGGNVQGIYTTVINPYTGGIYAMAGVNRDSSTGKKTANPLGNINQGIVMGSVVKPAILATGFQKGIITASNNTMYDQAIKIAGTPVITSYWNKAGTPTAIDALTALERSSNTYFVQLGMKIGGQTYVPGEHLALDSDAFQTLRNGLAQFGLGTKTGIDIEGETAGYRGPTTGEAQGKYLYESFGQYDSYTTLQLARYVSTIANGGYLVRPHLVGSVLQNDISNKHQKEVWAATPQLQGQVQLTADQWNVIHKGMERVANGTDPNNTGGGVHNLQPRVYAKTGTAETTTNGNSTFTESIVVYVPGQPFAMAMAIPGMDSYLDGTNGRVASEIINAFWDTVMQKPS
ncbi:peptidoglycan D,D-transpeptidase FtsI family protein [Convivina praedatoris]|uniref:Penicillin-binding protein 2B n=1 Tax=Convivina praedatoris TaxID=2880963 RepID=A0ABM9D0C7_9LACO|nr:penicillin-binding protein 2 [Convivina sp. LMG 32447]CAH1850165.1 Penicillin-binding protein 2B [Convivina sp. LMG 32447]CAH1851016.1 Penicillin-binding protein 2B [Convivina sp. LMG 32447]CAH1851030.1 Penicillin-binding protein 2B [Convivina sp. LMG 32447]